MQTHKHSHMSFIKSALKAIGITLVVLFTLAFLAALAMPSPEETQQVVNDLYSDTATDFIEQYEITKMHGTDVDSCLAAQQVASAYLHANSTEQYGQWKEVALVECQAAGLSF